ncbi:MAG TPA: YfiR family protein [Vicinamibacterales bacterium]|nr:YfiR family protein [Vicinamibacterales bacterium]
MAILRRLSLLALAASFVVGLTTASASGVPDQQIRAGFLYNFAMFVEWPTTPLGDPLLVGVLGDDVFASALRSIDGRAANGRKIVVRPVDESDDLARTSILYVGHADDRSAAATLARVGKKPVLTVGHSPRFTQVGGIVRLYTDGGKLRFEINTDRSNECALRISSKLLNLAKIVKEPR